MIERVSCARSITLPSKVSSSSSSSSIADTTTATMPTSPRKSTSSSRLRNGDDDDNDDDSSRKSHNNKKVSSRQAPPRNQSNDSIYQGKIKTRKSDDNVPRAPGRKISKLSVVQLESDSSSSSSSSSSSESASSSDDSSSSDSSVDQKRHRKAAKNRTTTKNQTTAKKATMKTKKQLNGRNHETSSQTLIDQEDQDEDEIYKSLGRNDPLKQNKKTGSRMTLRTLSSSTSMASSPVSSPRRTRSTDSASGGLNASLSNVRQSLAEFKQARKRELELKQQQQRSPRRSPPTASRSMVQPVAVMESPSPVRAPPRATRSMSPTTASSSNSQPASPAKVLVDSALVTRKALEASRTRAALARAKSQEAIEVAKASREARQLRQQQQQQPVTPVSKGPTTTKQARNRLEELEQQLKDIETKKAEELANIRRERLREVNALKEEYRIGSEKAKALAEKEAAMEQIMEEHRKNIANMRNENNAIREANKTLGTSVRALKTNNIRIEETMKERDNYRSSLEIHHARVSGQHEKLEAMAKEWEAKVQALQDEVDEKTVKVQAQHYGRRAYQNAMARIVEMVSLLDDKNTDEILAEIDEHLEELAKEIKEEGLLADEDDEVEEPEELQKQQAAQRAVVEEYGDDEEESESEASDEGTSFSSARKVSKRERRRMIV